MCTLIFRSGIGVGPTPLADLGVETAWLDLGFASSFFTFSGFFPASLTSLEGGGGPGSTATDW